MNTLRKQISDIIEQWEDSPNGAAHAAANICTLLNDSFDFGEQGHFDDDPELIEILVNRDLDD
ncbi:hypothetical protein F7T25_15990 [Salmonella enterica]|nr:hypothetical protein [Salmonella enterica]EDD8358794.1 hypothetical protein [Salmonella enterica subsp. enterica serovar Enteritidis]